jgi:hypothetical protein
VTILTKIGLPSWAEGTEIKAVLEIKGGTKIYFASLEDAKRLYDWAFESYTRHGTKIDFKKPRLLNHLTDPDAVFVEVTGKP